MLRAAAVRNARRRGAGPGMDECLKAALGGSGDPAMEKAGLVTENG